MLANCIINILELNWYQRFGEKESIKVCCSRRPLICKADRFTPWTRTTEMKCTEMNIARAKRAKLLFSWSNMQICHVLVTVVVVVA